MPTRPPLHRPMGQRTKRERGQEHDKRRTAVQPWRVWYKTPEWKALRLATFLRDVYQCRRCGAVVGKRGEATCDHIRPHRGDRALFFDPSNLQTLCKPCHDGPKQRDEARGYAEGCDLTGRTIDPGHPWNRR